MAIRIFTCPNTKLNVQLWLEGGVDIPENEYRSIICQDCTRLHFINPRTGKLLGQKEPQDLIDS
jgi:hypothetical protein